MSQDRQDDDMDPQPPRYLLLDDHGARVRDFENRVSGAEVEIITMHEAIELQDSRHDLEVLEASRA